MRRPGIEPGPRAWKARILTIELSTLRLLVCVAEVRRPGIEPGPRAWEARILTIELSTLELPVTGSGS